MPNSAKLTVGDKSYELPLVVGTETERAVDISRLRAETGLISLDDEYANTGSCRSAITYVGGEEGILRYRGIPIETLAERSTFVEVAYLLIFGELPTADQLVELKNLLSKHQSIHENLKHTFEGFPPNAPPMAILSAMVNAAGCFQPARTLPADSVHFRDAAARLISEVRTIAAASHKKSIGQVMIYPRYDLSYTANFLHMMFSRPHLPYEPDPEIVRALDLILILHADHGQNCSTSTVRMVGSSRANLYASVAAGVCALWGPLHGGANQAVIEMLSQIRDAGESPESFIAGVKDGKAGARLLGFGHRVYQTLDPRARILRQAADRVLEKLGIQDPLLEIAVRLEALALKDEYFIERRLYPNVDFYSGIVMRAIGIPLDMFPVMFAIGRMPGWIAQWRELTLDPETRIHRPRQIYVGPPQRAYQPLEDRG